MSTKTDIVYVLGTGSKWQDNELRYSLRSLHDHAKNVGSVYIIGERPQFLKNINHVYVKDRKQPCWKERNIMSKVLVACSLPELSENFLFLNDDHFFLPPVSKIDISKFPFYHHKNELEETLERRKRGREFNLDRYARSLRNTVRVLKERGLPLRHYDIHVPILYNKKHFVEIMAQYDWEKYFGYVVKSLYSNTLGVTPVELSDCKLLRSMSYKKIEARIEDRIVFSISDSSLSFKLKHTLQTLYPNHSPWEKIQE